MWGVPVDHACFKEISNAQWLWYFYNFSKDTETRVEEHRDLLEYHAWFGNSEMVSKLQEQRELEEGRAAFEKQTESVLGGGISCGTGVQSSGDVRDLGNILDRVDAIDRDRETRDKEVIPYNFTKWTDFDLE